MSPDAGYRTKLRRTQPFQFCGIVCDRKVEVGGARNEQNAGPDRRQSRSQITMVSCIVADITGIPGPELRVEIRRAQFPETGFPMIIEKSVEIGGAGAAEMKPARNNPNSWPSPHRRGRKRGWRRSAPMRNVHRQCIRVRFRVLPSAPRGRHDYARKFAHCRRR